MASTKSARSSGEAAAVASDQAFTGRTGAGAQVGQRARLALAAVDESPEPPLGAGADGVTGVPELGRDAGVGGVLQHAAPLAVLDLVGQLGAELEIETPVVDRPAAIGLHVDAVPDLGDHLLQR